MSSTRLARVAAAGLLAALAAGCGGKKKATALLCPLPAPSASTLPAAPSAGEAWAIHFGTRITGETVTFAVPPGTASVSIVQQAASSAVPLALTLGGTTFENTPVPLTVTVDGAQIYSDLPSPPDAAFVTVDGLTVLDPLADPGLSVYFLSEAAWTGTFTVPNTSRAIPGTGAGEGVPAGTWSFLVNDWAAECRSIPGCSVAAIGPSSYDVTVILKPAAAPSSALQVVFYLVTSSGLTAAGALSDARAQRLAWAMEQILARAGITPTFAWRDVPLDIRLRFATGVDARQTGVCGNFGQLLALAEPGNQLNVFLVDLIRDSGGGSGAVTVGIDGTVPGPSSFGGTPASGVVVSMADLDHVAPPPSAGCVPGTLSLETCGPDIVAIIAAHEAGHFLGLHHTTEGIGSIVDPIADTATCLCSRCKPASATSYQCRGVDGRGANGTTVTQTYYMDIADCLAPPGSVPECGGGGNLMFWLLGLGLSQGIVSADQAAVMRANPLVR